jgi:tetratricopeptide (TPR) repeat protein
MEEPELDISEYYSYTAAMEDFQAGVKLFQTKNFDQAFETLRKVLIRFEHEENKHLIMEVLFIMGSMFTQQKKFKTAKEYFKRLNVLADELQHDKYFETSSFMEGFCDYKNENIITASNKLEKIDISKSKFINKLQYFSIYGRILANQENFQLAKENFIEALKISTTIKESDLTLRQKLLILHDLGVTNYKIGIEILKNSGIKKEEEYLAYLKEAIDYFNKAIGISKKLDDFNMLSQIYQLIGNIYEFIGDNSKALESYDDALISAEKSNNFSRKVIILGRIIQKLTELGKHEDCVAKINDFLTYLDEYKFIDLFTVSKFHKSLANSLILLGKKEDGLSHLTKAYEIIKTFKTPVSEELEILNQIVEIFSELKNDEKVKLFKEEIEIASNKLEKISYQKPKTFRPLGEIKEIWIFHSIAGVELYNYAMESKIDNDLLGGFLTALRQFSMEISQKQLNDMNIGNNCYMIYQEEGYHFYLLGRADAKVSKEIMSRILSKVYRRFWKEYSKHIIDFQGNIIHFKNFTSIIESLDLTLTR